MMLAAPERRGAIAGLLTAGIFIGQFISPFASQPWIARSGYPQTFQEGGLLLILVAAASWMLRGRFKQ